MNRITLPFLSLLFGAVSLMGQSVNIAAVTTDRSGTVAIPPMAGQVIEAFPTNVVTVNFGYSAINQPSTADLLVNGNVRASKTLSGNSNGSDTLAFTPGFVEGTKDLQVRITSGGQTVLSSVVGLNVIATGPAVQLTVPADNQNYLIGQTVAFESSTIFFEGAVSSVQYSVNGTVVGSSTTGPAYRVTWTANAVGTFTVQATMTSSSGTTYDAQPKTIVVRRQSSDFAGILHTDLTGRVLSESELNAATDSLNSGAVSPVEYIRNLVNSPQVKTFEEVQLAEYMFRGRFLSPGQTISSANNRLNSTSATFITPFMDEFIARLFGSSATTGNLTGPQEVTLAEQLFEAKYGVIPNPIQRQRLLFEVQSAGPINTAGTFTFDNEILVLGGERFTRNLRIIDPPNSDAMLFAQTANLIQGITRAQPSFNEVVNLSSLSLDDRIATLLADPRFAARDITVPGAPNLSPFANSTDIGNGWKYEPFFGRFFDGSFPFIYSDIHGFLFTVQASGNGFWFYFPDQGWMYASRDNAPVYFYRNADRTWLYYLPESNNPRWFYNFSTESWESR